ncbi:DUF6262 family protein [Peribacillus sp. FSL R5-0717]|uniref:DUF6262 family protein n=1 Tax=Peribacillus sp. FSL R5-0717 TaxID=2975308 RepID=UPI0030F5D1BD
MLLDAISKYIKAFSQVLQRLIKTKAKINFNRVAKVSGLSKAFLYTNLEIRNRIEEGYVSVPFQ